MKDVLLFLSELAEHNDRVWFAANKERYKACMERFTRLGDEWIDRLKEIEPEMAGVHAKDCIWRIYRDTRFSNDKRPYKEWFGVFPAVKGGRKSVHAGYYLHVQPGHCLFSSGIWCPSPELLKVLRQEIYANYDEVEAIMQAPEWQKYFTDFDTDDMLKTAPKGYDKDWVHIDWLKRKSFTTSTMLSEELVCSEGLLDELMARAKAVKKMNDFLNYTFEEYGEFPRR